MANQETSITIRAIDKASYAVLGVAAKLEVLNKSLNKTSQLGYAFGEIGKQLAPAWSRLSAVGDRWATAARRVSVASIAVGGATAGMVGFAKSAADAADRIGDLSARYQVGTRVLQVYGSLLEDSGASTEDTAAAIGKLTKAQGEAIAANGEARAAFAGVGISVQELKNSKPEDLLLKMADRFKGSNKDLAKQAVLLQLMGKNGTIFMETMNKGGEAYKNRLKELQSDGSLLSAQQTEFADRFSNKWARMTRTLGGLRAKLGLQLAERLEPLLEKFQTWISGPGGKLLEEKFNKIFTSENIESFGRGLVKLAQVLLAVGKAFLKIVDAIGPTATALAGLAIVFAPVITALASTVRLFWDFGRALVFLGLKIPGVSSGLGLIGGRLGAIGTAARASIAGVQAFGSAALTALAPVAIAAAAAFAAFKAFQAYERLSATQARGAADNGVRGNKRAAYDTVLRSVGGDRLAAGYGKNTDFNTLNQVVSGLEQGGKVAPGTAARLAAMPVDVQGKIKIEISSPDVKTRITEIQKSGPLNIEAMTGLNMAGG